MPPKKIKPNTTRTTQEKRKWSWRNQRVGPFTSVANPFPISGRKHLAPELETKLMHSVATKTLRHNPLVLSPITVSNPQYFTPNEDGSVTINTPTARHTGPLRPRSDAQDAYNPPTLLNYRGLQVPPNDLIHTRRSPLSYPNSYPGKIDTGDEASKQAGLELDRIPKPKYLGGRKRRKRKKNTRKKTRSGGKRKKNSRKKRRTRRKRKKTRR